jgi:hypothetical protein
MGEKEAKRTATPWLEDQYGNLVDAKGDRIVFSGAALSTGPRNLEAEENTKFARLACNAHDDLLEFALFVLRGLESGNVKSKPWMNFDPNSENAEIRSLHSYAREVIAKAGAAQ